MGIRSAAKAIILDDGKILLNRCYDEKNGEYFSLPGGGQNLYETLHETIIRECIEETGYTVTPLRFAALYEEICDDTSFREKYPDYAHKMLHVFVCSLFSQKVKKPTETDSSQITSEWIDIDSLKSIRLLPKAVGDNIRQIIDCDSPVFLGSEHIPFNHG
ncbi:MAG: NUDIX domain-containing protein [Clostridiaceae bacterium]